MLAEDGRAIADDRVAFSGVGKAALHVAKKPAKLDARVITPSNRHDVLVAEVGFGPAP
jgi:glutamate dehydrogenase/leucine dehydrogenase